MEVLPPIKKRNKRFINKRKMEAIETQIEASKAKGNEAFRNKQYDVAVKFYSDAIDAAVSVSSQFAGAEAGSTASASSNLHLLYSNRGQAHLQLNRPDQALQDAIRSIESNPKWLKG